MKIKILGQISLILILISIYTINCQKTAIDDFKLRPLFRTYREMVLGLISTPSKDDLFRKNQRNGKIQKQFSNDVPFFCDVNGPGARSVIPPQSVHQLKPGDIDIIAAMGDSLTAGNGAMALDILQIFVENKGISWSIGGDADWRKYLTLPNILKEFNPNLYGYSLSAGYSHQKLSRFNVAEIGAMSRDMPYMSKVLVKRMYNDPKVDIENHWKLITMMIGPNDFCADMCYHDNPENVINLMENDLLAVLRTLRDNLPRTMVNVVFPPSMKVLLNFVNKPQTCVPVHVIECPCMFATRFAHNMKRFLNIMDNWNVRVEEIANREEFHFKDDFTVNVQKFTNKLKFPKLQNGNTDFTYMSTDCFHMSQKAYAAASNALWNNMLEPADQKTQNWKKEFRDFKCPTAESPFLTTKKNSR